jgi:hypothetical protein
MLLDTTIQCWGQAVNGKLGTGTSNPSIYVPTPATQFNTGSANVKLMTSLWNNSYVNIKLIEVFGGGQKENISTLLFFFPSIAHATFSPTLLWIDICGVGSKVVSWSHGSGYAKFSIFSQATIRHMKTKQKTKPVLCR